MTRKLKALGIALVAVFAMSVVVAQAAQAHEFTASQYPAVVTGGFANAENPDKFTLEGLGITVICSSAVFEGTASGASEELTITPTYGSTSSPSGCKETTFNTEAIVHTNHCAYVFHGATDANEHAAVDVECAAGNAIEVTLPGLGIDLSIGAQAGLKGVHYTNETIGGHKVVKVDTTVSGITVSCTDTAETGLCELIGNGKIQYTGTELVKGYVDTGSAQTGTAKTTPELSMGEQIDVTVE